MSTNGTFKILSWIGGFFIFMVLLYTTFHQPLVLAIAKEAEARQSCDAQISSEIGKKLDVIITQNVDIKTVMAGAMKQIEINTSRLGKLEDKIYK
ncbi:MAG: hypothetical protein V1709_10330 [Planctomycetota bacterium]